MSLGHDDENVEFALQEHASKSNVNDQLTTNIYNRHCGNDLLEKNSSPDTPVKDLRTPVKCLAQGYYFSGQQINRTPNARPHLGLLSGVQGGPASCTPNSGGALSRTANLCKHKTPGSSAKSTPLFTTPGGTTHRVKRNPFDSPSQAEMLHNHVFSPNCLKSLEPGSAEKTPTTFRWSIDQIAELNPADIDEMPIQQDTINLRKDSLSEASAQMAIDAYFSSSHVAPSPWSKPLPKHILPPTPGGSSDREVAASPMLQYLKQTGKFRSQFRASPTLQTVNEVSCQTALSLPVDFDLQQILGEHYTQDADMKSVIDESTTNSGDFATADLSTSSLRRKLFFHGDMGTPLSPVRSSRRSRSSHVEYAGQVSPDVSPVRRRSQGQPVTAAQFSSSPIRDNKVPMTSYLRKCSTAPNFETFTPPLVSPICLTKNNCEQAEEDEFLVHHSGDGPLQGTPSPGLKFRQRIEIPDFSPIHDANRSSSGKENFDLERPYHSLDNIPMQQSSTNVSKSSFTNEFRDNSTIMDHSMAKRSDIRFRLSPEDYDEGVSLISEKDISDHEEVISSYHSAGYCTTSQDTGYQTESIHGGTQNSSEFLMGNTHTNLTTQFGQMPLNSESATSSPTEEISPPFARRLSSDNENACFEMAIPISTSQVRPVQDVSSSPQLSNSGPEFSKTVDGMKSSCPLPFKSERRQSGHVIKRQISLPADLHPHPPSIPISISRQPSVSFDLSESIEQQEANEKSPAPDSILQHLSEKEVIARARAILGKDAHSSPEEEQAGVPVQGFPWYTDSAETPQRERFTGLAKKLQRRQHDVHSMLPSEVAYEVLRKAGVDYEKVCSGAQLDETCFYENDQHADMSFQ